MFRLRTLLIGIVIGTAMLVPVTAAANNARRPYLAAVDFLSEGKNDRALELLEECIRREDEPGTFYASKSRVMSYVPYLRLAQALQALGETDAAVEAYNQAVARGTAAELEIEDLTDLGAALVAGGAQVDVPSPLPAEREAPKKNLEPVPATPTPTPTPTAVPVVALDAPVIEGEVEIISPDGNYDFSWHEVEGAGAYVVEIANSPEFLEPRTERQRFRMFGPANPLGEGEHAFVRIRAAGGGEPGPPSAVVHISRPAVGLGQPVQFDNRARAVSPGGVFREAWTEVEGVDHYRVEMRSGSRVQQTMDVEFAEIEMRAPTDISAFDLVVIPVRGEDTGVESVESWKVGAGLEGPDVRFDPVAGALFWPPVPLAHHYDVSYGSFENGSTGLPFLDVDPSDRCIAAASGVVCNAPLRDLIKEGRYLFGVTAVRADGTRSLERVVEVEIVNLTPAAQEALAEASRLILEDGDGVGGLEVMAPFVAELEGRARFHLIVAVGAFLANAITEEVPGVYGATAADLVATHFGLARQIDPAIELPEDVTLNPDIVNAFDAAVR